MFQFRKLSKVAANLRRNRGPDENQALLRID